MSATTRVHCKRCGKHKSECGPISWRGNCRPCGKDAQTENIVGIATMTGDAFHRWQQGNARAWQFVKLDGSRADVQTGSRAD